MKVKVTKLPKKKMDKLSEIQKNVLTRMTLDQWYNAYELRCSLATLEALRRKGLVEEGLVAGSFFSPRTLCL
jgi:hypothetical protein